MLKAIDHSCLQVRDLKRSQKYYEDLFGLEFRPHLRNEQVLMAEGDDVHFFMEQSNLSLEFLKKQHISFEVDDLGKWREKLVTRDIKYKEGSYDGFKKRNYDWVEWRDIDGIRLEVVKTRSNSKLQNYFSQGRVYVLPERYAMIQAREINPSAFTNIVDDMEVTVIIDENQVDEANVIKIESGWKVFTLDIVFPPDVCGVTATIATALAEEGISIMPLAAFSRDHFLIKENDEERAKEVFAKLGIQVE
jgi:uncharacterized protein